MELSYEGYHKQSLLSLSIYRISEITKNNHYSPRKKNNVFRTIFGHGENVFTTQEEIESCVDIVKEIITREEIIQVEETNEDMIFENIIDQKTCVTTAEAIKNSVI